MLSNAKTEDMTKNLILTRIMSADRSATKALLLMAILSLLFGISALDAKAATIHGTIYDVSLTQESNVRLEINTVPEQKIISKTGEYSINLSIGNYTLKAANNDGRSEENITVESEDGDYTIDMVLGQDIENPYFAALDNNITVSNSDLADNTNNIKINAKNDSLMLVWMIIIVLVLILVGLFLAINRNKSNNDNIENKDISTDLNTHASNSGIIDEYGRKVFDIIKKEQRIAQKDLRKQIPLSEGKISLIISDLENLGKIRKIKKGRGNILVFVKE